MSNEGLIEELPDWRVAWEVLGEQYPWLAALRGCPQDPIHHAEGDVWIHTGMVCASLTELPRFLALPEGDQRLLFMAALLHDVAKPSCTREEPDGRISSRGHSRRGAVAARAILWRLRVSFA